MLDRVNDFLQGYLDLVVGTHRLLRSMADELIAAGHPVSGVESLDAMIAEYERWQDDLPEDWIGAILEG